MKINLIRVVEFNENKSFHPRDVIPSFELLNIASLLKKEGHKIKLFDNEVLSLNSHKFEKLINKNDADIYVFHFQPIAANALFKIIKKLKTKSKKITIAFGPTVEYQTEEFLKKSFADYAILGEVELTILKLINTIFKKYFLSVKEKENIDGLAFLNKNKFIKNKLRPLLDPNSLPFLAHELIQNQKYKVVSKIIQPKKKIKWGFLLSSRGCPFNCAFCAPSIRNSIGKKYRYQTPKRTVDEMEYMIKKYKVTAISIEDDIFTLNRQRVLSICEEIIKRQINISWTVATRLDCLDLKLLTLMKKAGCQGVSTGVESGSDRILKLINKGEKTKDIIKGIELLNKVDIATTINLIVGHPTETLKDLKLTVNIVKKIRPVFIHLHYFTPYPGTQIFEEYQKKLNYFKKYSHRQLHKFNISSLDTKTLQKMVKKIYFSHYINISFLKTYLKYRKNYWIYDPLFEIKFLINTFSYFFLLNRDD